MSLPSLTVTDPQTQQPQTLSWSTEKAQTILRADRTVSNAYKVKQEYLSSPLNSRPIPTNAWWQNLIIEQGDQPVVACPYMVKCLEDGVVICAPSPLTEENFVASVWHDDWKINIPGCDSCRQVVGFDPMSVTVQYGSREQAVSIARVPLVKGSAFITVLFDSPTALELTTIHAIIAVDCHTYGPGTAVVQLNSGTSWLICYEPSANAVLRQDGMGRLVFDRPICGPVRIALVNGSVPSLLQSRQCIPIGGNVNVNSPDETIAWFTVSWKTIGQGEPLMCALPHHQVSLVNATWVDDVGKYWTSKGYLQAVRGHHWQWMERMESLGFSGATPLNGEDKERLSEVVKKDVAGLEPLSHSLPQDPYFFGKALAKATRIALIADEIGDQESRDMAIHHAKTWFEPWLTGTNSNCLVYDREWRGLVSKNGANDPNADFGQGRYNDHHFHYGYFAYAAAALAKLCPDWLNSDRRQAVDLFVRDYCNPAPPPDASSTYEGDSADFPFMRCFDFYDGHSWASGLFAFADSRNQESTSEAINAYYGAYLYASVTQRLPLAGFIRTVLELEARTSRTYWHLDDLVQGVYPDIYSKGQAVVGILWSSKADYATFFGANPEFIYGIQFLPYTPATALLLKREWVARIWPTYLKAVADNSQSEPWREIINLAYAVVDKQQTIEWTVGNDQHDDGNSASNAYYWIATAPSSSQ